MYVPYPYPFPCPGRPQDEFWTSQRCHRCTDFLTDGPRHREKHCTTCGVVARDVNAAINLQKVWERFLHDGKRPEYLQRPEAGPKRKGAAAKGQHGAASAKPKPKPKPKPKAAPDPAAAEGSSRDPQ